jgi:hypothetical protein
VNERILIASVPSSTTLNFPDYGENLGRFSVGLGQPKNQFRITMQTPGGNPLIFIEHINQRFQNAEKEREAAQWGWEREVGKSFQAEQNSRQEWRQEK